MYAADAETVGEQWAEKKIQKTNNCVTRAWNEFCADSTPTQEKTNKAQKALKPNNPQSSK